MHDLIIIHYNILTGQRFYNEKADCVTGQLLSNALKRYSRLRAMLGIRTEQHHALVSLVQGCGALFGRILKILPPINVPIHLQRKHRLQTYS